MGDERNGAWQRRPWLAGSEPETEGWLSLNDDDLLYQVEAAVASEQTDQALLEVVCSDRHFFIRQEAAKKISDPGLLKKHADDRHIGQVLVRTMTRVEDVIYLELLIRETRHLEVRKAAQAQLRLLTAGE
jgi:hypothetical protein